MPWVQTARRRLIHSRTHASSTIISGCKTSNARSSIRLVAAAWHPGSLIAPRSMVRGPWVCSGYYGDMTRTEILRHVGLDTARALVVTLDDAAAAQALVTAARAERAALVIVARARDVK